MILSTTRQTQPRSQRIPVDVTHAAVIDLQARSASRSTPGGRQAAVWEDANARSAASGRPSHDILEDL